jgi:hypothetical protein
MSAKARAMQQDRTCNSSEAAVGGAWTPQDAALVPRQDRRPLCASHIDRLRQLDEACGGAGFGRRR